MSRRSEADHDESGGRVAESRNRATPVFVVPELPFLFPSHPLAISDQARAPRAGDHLTAHGLE
jgi:hypothetical protein